MIDELFQLLGGVIGLQIDPADDPRHERIRVGQLEQPSRFFERLARLHRHAGVHGRAIHFAAQIGWQKTAAQRRHCIVDPAYSAAV